MAKGDQAYASARAERLFAAAEERLRFKRDEDEYRLGVLANNAWVLMAVQGMVYLAAWESKRPRTWQPSNERTREPYLQVINPIPPFTPEFLGQVLLETFSGVGDLVARREQQVATRQRQFEADLLRQFGRDEVP